MPINKDQLEKFNFFHTHDIVMNGDSPTFQRQGAVSPTCASIYMWLSPTLNDATQFDTMYIGKAGYGVERRQSQHKGGFTHSGTGRANCTLITEWLTGGRTLHVYARVSEFSNIFEKDTSLYSAEEAAACAAFEPRWNRANFPQVPSVVDQESVAPTPKNINTPEKQAPNGVEENTEAKINVAFQNVPQGDEVGIFVESLDLGTKNKFLRVMNFLQNKWPEATQKIVGGYSDQPRGYNGKPMLVIANVREADGKAVDWFARVPLINEENSPLTIIFHRKLLNQSVESIRISKGNKKDWRPIDLEDFLRNHMVYFNK